MKVARGFPNILVPLSKIPSKIADPNNTNEREMSNCLTASSALPASSSRAPRLPRILEMRSGSVITPRAALRRARRKDVVRRDDEWMESVEVGCDMKGSCCFTREVL